MRMKSVQLSRAASAKTRSWDDLNYDLLVDIIKRLPWYARLYVVCLVNKTWLSAVLDSMSTHGVINLKIIDSPELEKLKFRYCRFLKRMLDNKPIDSWSALILCENMLTACKYLYIAKRTPSLQQLIIPCTLGRKFRGISYAFKHWKKLKRVQCPAWLVKDFPDSFRRVKSLRLFGIVDDVVAIAIRDHCPRLKQLRLGSCAFSVDALAIILDGHKNLELLDTRHGFRVSDCNLLSKSGYSKSLEWNEEEISHKAAGIKAYLMCDQQHCAQCAPPYKCCFPDRRPLLKDANRGLPGSCLFALI